MTPRTIEQLRDRRCGHPKFAKVCDLLVSKGYEVTEIKEYYEKFKFKVNGFNFEYSKFWKASANQYVNYLIDTYNQELKIIELQGGSNQ